MTPTAVYERTSNVQAETSPRRQTASASGLQEIRTFYGPIMPVPAPATASPSVPSAPPINELAAGHAIVLIDQTNHAHGVLMCAAQLATPALVSFIVRHSAGLVVVPMTENECDRLDLPSMVTNQPPHADLAFSVAVDAASGIATGISATDRARTIRLLADPATTADDLTRPGHVIPIRVAPTTGTSTDGFARAALRLVTAAGLRPAAAMATIVNDNGSMPTMADLVGFAEANELATMDVSNGAGPIGAP